MAIDTSNEILSDFLTEAGELVRRLADEQLIEMEKHPDDADLLNAIFRAFHTVKGGAGFLGFTVMVDLCHASEDVFNLLRSGKMRADQAVMDAILQSTDHLQTMMAEVSDGREPTAAPAELIERLHALCKPGAAAPAPVVVSKPEAPVPKAGSKDEITEEEFDQLLDELHGKPSPSAAKPAANAGEITEEEFDQLLDQLHGAGKGPGVATAAPAVPAAPPSKPGATPVRAASAAPPVETTVRVDTFRLDKMMNLVGELVLVRNRLKTLRGSASEDLSKAIGHLDFITRNLQGAVMQIRMQPIRKIFSRFPKVARDVARGLGKQVDVELIGEETDLDKNLVDALADPLVHMVRNAVDHGIEMPDARLKVGKPATGKLVLAAKQQGDSILISVSDDGAGIDPEKLRAKVIEKGLIERDAALRLTPDECLQLVFMPGFSTKEQISDLSGRGVGMDVVKSAITQLKGSVTIESRIGHGSVVNIRLPLTLAILPALMVCVGDRIFAMPLASVIDVTVLNPANIRRIEPWDMVTIREQMVRLVYLDRWAGIAGDPSAPRHVVLAQVHNERYGFVVSQVRGREEVVIKPLGTLLRGLSGLAGATVTGQGRVALILDFPGLIQAYEGRG